MNLCRAYDLNSFLFYIDRPIASIAFHANGELLAVASGHKVRFFDFQLNFRSFMAWSVIVFGWNFHASYIYGAITVEGKHLHQELY